MDHLRKLENVNLALIKARARSAARDVIIGYRVFISSDWKVDGPCRLHFDWAEKAAREIANHLGISLPKDFGYTHPENAYAIALEMDQIVDACTALSALRIGSGRLNVRSLHAEALHEAVDRALGFFSPVDKTKSKA